MRFDRDGVPRESPRQRIHRMNLQIGAMRERFGEDVIQTREQPLCTFCEHLCVTYDDWSGGVEADCMVNAPRWEEGEYFIEVCGKFRAEPDWRVKVEKIVAEAWRDAAIYWRGRGLQAEEEANYGRRMD